MSLIERMSKLSRRLGAIPERFGVPLYLVENLEGVEPFKCRGKIIRRAAYVNQQTSIGDGIMTIEDYLELTFSADYPKPEQDFLVVDGLTYRVINVTYNQDDMINYKVLLKKDLDIV